MVKKSKTVAIVATLLIAAAGLITIQSCKKEQNKLLNTQTVQEGIKHPQKIDDMDAYLKGFGEKMLNSKDNEMLTLEEAAWHLTAYQNFMYADVDDYYTDIVYDEKDYTIPVSNGMVSLSDLGLLFNNTAKDIVKFYQSSMLDNKKIMYVISEIDESGKVTVNMALTNSGNSKYYYFNFENEFDSIVFCDSLFPNQFGYHWKEETPGILTQQIRNFGPASMRPHDYERKYYSSYVRPSFDHNDYPGRVFYCDNCTYNNHLTPDEMCFYLDSYLGIVMENKPQGYDVVQCTVKAFWGNPDLYSENPETPVPAYHELKLIYGNPNVSPNHPIFD